MYTIPAEIQLTFHIAPSKTFGVLYIILLLGGTENFGGNCYRVTGNAKIC